MDDNICHHEEARYMVQGSYNEWAGFKREKHARAYAKQVRATWAKESGEESTFNPIIFRVEQLEWKE